MSENRSWWLTPNPKGARVAKIIFGICVAFILLVLLIPAEDKEKDEAAEQEKESPELTAESSAQDIKEAFLAADNSIQGVQVTDEGSNKDIDIKMHISGAWDTAGYLVNTGMYFAHAAEKIFDGSDLAQAIDMVNIDIQVPVEDEYGNESERVVGRLALSGHDLGQINWDNIDYHGVIRFAQVKDLDNLGRQMVQAFCQNDLNRDRTGSFCFQSY